MENEPPIEDEAVQPPYSGYYRPQQLYGNPARLKALEVGYYGQTYVYVVGVFTSVALVGAVQPGAGSFIPVYIAGMILTGLSAIYSLKKLAFAMDKSLGWIIMMCLFCGLGINCCLFLAPAVIQSSAAKEARKYGIPSGFFGIGRKAFKARIAELESIDVAGARITPDSESK